jgi:hypothetical protein
MIGIECITLFVALATFGLAYMQYRNERYKVKVDLFDRRYRIYESVGEILSRCITGCFTENDPYGFAFINKISKTERAARLLFNEEIRAKVKEVCDNAILFMEISSKINPKDGVGLVGPELKKMRAELSRLRKFFPKTLSNLELMFEAQMRLHK